VDVGARNAAGVTAMYIAAAHGHTAVVELLADEGGADVSEGTLADAKMLLVESWKTENPP
jgi:ankyrin repeat protein